MELTELWQLTARTITVLIVLWTMTIIMGKRLIGKLPVIDFMIALTIGNIAGADLADLEIPHIPTLVAIALLGGLHFAINKSLLKSSFLNKKLSFAPTVIIQNGELLTDELTKQSLKINDLMALLRKQGIFDLAGIEYAILETTGDISLLQKAEQLPVTKKDLQIPTNETKGFPLVIIADGKLEQQAIKYIDKNEDWVKAELTSLGYQEMSNVFLGVLNEDQSWYIAEYQHSHRANHPVK